MTTFCAVYCLEWNHYSVVPVWSRGLFVPLSVLCHILSLYFDCTILDVMCSLIMWFYVALQLYHGYNCVLCSTSLQYLNLSCVPCSWFDIGHIPQYLASTVHARQQINHNQDKIISPDSPRQMSQSSHTHTDRPVFCPGQQ